MEKTRIRQPINGLSDAVARQIARKDGSLKLGASLKMVISRFHEHSPRGQFNSGRMIRPSPPLPHPPLVSPFSPCGPCVFPPTSFVHRLPVSSNSACSNSLTSTFQTFCRFSPTLLAFSRGFPPSFPSFLPWRSSAAERGLAENNYQDFRWSLLPFAKFPSFLFFGKVPSIPRTRIVLEFSSSLENLLSYSWKKGCLRSSISVFCNNNFLSGKLYINWWKSLFFWTYGGLRIKHFILLNLCNYIGKIWYYLHVWNF